MPGALVIRNQQRTRRVNIRLLERISRAVLEEFLELENYDLAIHLVATRRITSLNEQFLRHAGPTDVITFDYSDHASRTTHHTLSLHGEIFVCVQEAVSQARRFRTTWQSELARYAIHGILHLMGYDDQKPARRYHMKRREDALLSRLSRRFALSKLARKSRVSP